LTAPPFEKGGRKLSRFLPFNKIENFRQGGNLPLNFAHRANINSRLREINLREAQH
jgi:hypothetical protein